MVAVVVGTLRIQVGRFPVQREFLFVVVRVHGVRAKEEFGGRDGRYAVVHGALEEAAFR